MQDETPARPAQPWFVRIFWILLFPLTAPLKGLIFLSRKVPGGLMVVPLLAGALLSTVDRMHLESVQWALKGIGAKPTVKSVEVKPDNETKAAEVAAVRARASAPDGKVVVLTDGPREMLHIGGFAEAMINGPGALCLIGLFLFCAGSQMNVRVAGRAVKKGLILTLGKYAAGVGVGYALGQIFGPYEGLLGLSSMAIIAAMTNSNGGMYAALTAQYGNRSDVGAIAILSLNDGPFLTLMALGLLGETFPTAVFLAVLLPILLGIVIGNIDEKARTFLQAGERLTIPFFAFALGTTISFLDFGKPQVLAAGVLLGLLTFTCTALVGILALRLFREKSTIAAVAEASTAGNAAATPAAIAAAAAASMKAGTGMSAEQAERYAAMVSTATAQISISTVLTALLCPLAVILWYRWQLRHGIDARREDLV